MAAEARIGTFASSVGGVGTKFSITGLPFAPTGLFVWSIGFTTDPDSGVVAQSDLRRSYGFASKPDAKMCALSSWQKLVASPSETRRWYSGNEVAIVPNNDALASAFDVFSWNSDGVTFEITRVGTPLSRRFYFLALGGDIDAGIVTRALPTVNGNFDTTGFGFGVNQPEAVLMMSFGDDGALPNQKIWSEIYIGVAVSGTQQGYLGGADKDGVATTEARTTCHQGNECLARVKPSSSIKQRLNFVSWLTDGVRLNMSAAGDADWLFLLGLRGGDFDVKEFLTSTSAPATIPITGLPSRPAGGLVFSGWRSEDAAGSTQPDDRMSLGGFSSAATTEQRVGLIQSLDSQTGSRTGHGAGQRVYLSTTNVHPAAKQGEAKVSAIGPTNLDLEQTVADSVSRFGFIFTIGPALPPAPTNLVATAVGPNQIDLDWDDVVGADDYKVYRESPIGGGFSLVHTVSGPAPPSNWSDTTVLPSTQYNYYVTTVIGVEESGPSNESNATTPAPGGGKIISPTIMGRISRLRG